MPSSGGCLNPPDYLFLGGDRYTPSSIDAKARRNIKRQRSRLSAHSSGGCLIVLVAAFAVRGSQKVRACCLPWGSCRGLRNRPVAAVGRSSRGALLSKVFLIIEVTRQVGLVSVVGRRGWALAAATTRFSRCLRSLTYSKIIVVAPTIQGRVTHPKIALHRPRASSRQGSRHMARVGVVMVMVQATLL